VSEIFLPKIIKVCWSVFQLWQGCFSSGFLFISTHISLGLLSLGSAEAYTGWGGKMNGHLMASCVRNILTKNYQNLIIGFQVKVKNVGDAFFEAQCICYKLLNHVLSQIFSNTAMTHNQWCMIQHQKFTCCRLIRDSVTFRVYSVSACSCSHCWRAPPE